MEFLTHQLLDSATTEYISTQLLNDKSNWIDGRMTAGSHAAVVKNNLELDRKSNTSMKLSSQINQAIIGDKLLKGFTLPRNIHGIMFTRSSEGQGYGMHVDNAYMSSGRSDLSFTLFLSDPNSYKGGELCIQSINNANKIKLPAGHIVFYPSTTLHSVETVTQGNRLVCVGWIQSYITSNEDRNMLFGLEAGARGLLAKHGRSDELDLIFQAYNNLLRRLGD